ncbi:MAG: hypothetical protein MR415_02005 [Coriobacteriaceae bacterium]|nr:hypothetical protein [Coriobacteriaceae bacterium]MCI7439015.1 hypothetical protein [Coriobacteriaceae bacterium]
MREEKTVVMEDGAEKRTLSWGELEDGIAYARETSEGDVTDFAFGAKRRQTTFVFLPTSDYNLDDVENRIETSGGDCFICDFADALEFWGIPYKREDKIKRLAA